MPYSAEYTVPIDRLSFMRVVKKLVASKKGISDWQQGILLRHRLIEDLRFTADGVGSLTPNLNDCFERVELALTPDKVKNCKTVRELVNLAWGGIPDWFKSSANL